MNYKEQFIEFINNIDLSLANIIKETEPDFISELRIKTSYIFFTVKENDIELLKKGVKESYIQESDNVFTTVKDRFTYKKICDDLEMKMYRSLAKTLVVNFTREDEDVKQAFFANHVKIT